MSNDPTERHRLQALATRARSLAAPPSPEGTTPDTVDFSSALRTKSQSASEAPEATALALKHAVELINGSMAHMAHGRSRENARKARSAVEALSSDSSALSSLREAAKAYLAAFDANPGVGSKLYSANLELRAQTRERLRTLSERTT